MRTSLVPIAACAILFLALISCDSPGEPYRYRDVKLQPGPNPSLAAPGTATPVTISFSIFNTDLEPVGPVEWQATLDSDPTPIASGTIASLARQTWQSQSFVTLPSPGAHIYTVRVDPRNLIEERDEANNTGVLILVFADANLSFSTAPSVAPAAPTVSDALTLSATVLNSDTSGALATVNNVVVLVREDATDLASTTIPSLAAGATATVAIPLPAATAGDHVYTVIIDPDAAITVRDRQRTTSSVGVSVAAPAPVPN